jgi:phospholipase D-like protein
MVGDDDLYWLDPVTGPSAKTGDNESFEADNIARLEQVGGARYEMRYMETNHSQHLLHHSKYLLYRKANGEPFGLIAGAANLTATGFNDNFENIYFIKIPRVLSAFDTQFARIWDGRKATASEQDPPIATPRGLMPSRDVAGQ